MRPQVSNLSLLACLLHFLRAVIADVPPLDASQALEISQRDAGAKADTKVDANKVDSRLVGSTRPDVGTKDAPVDGMDGKPHAGPWVDASLDPEKKKDASKTGPSRERVIPEDSVMNDPNRQSPKKGTTGTEGGVSEKTKEQKAKEEETGRQRPKKPESPKDAASVPHNEESEKDKGDRRNGSESPERQSTTDTQGTDKTDPKERSRDKDKPKGDLGLEVRQPQNMSTHFVRKLIGILFQKPDDLPKKPHDIPHPKPHSSQEDAVKGAGLTEPPQGIETNSSDKEEEEGVHDFIPWDSLAGSISSIAATEIGDKTFIVAALMAMRHPRLQVFTAAFSALFIMTILSGITGHAVGAVMSKRWAALVAALLFLGFGAKSLKEGMEMNPSQGVSEEIREVQAELEEKELDMSRQIHGYGPSLSPYALEAGRASPHPQSPSPSPSRSASPSHYKTPGISGFRNLLSLVLSPAWVETFSMTFIGELGDRSQIATVAMAAGQEYFWVMVGATLGHAVCTAVAVIGGSVLAGRITMRKVTLIGGGIFIGFGLFTLLEAIQYWR
ncbi:MAG: hypothetical protein M1828_004358 [Chrysothrix sp. TS-e1954]|nr:MAG: hypothetical protein M1828_004358 [Chrysothrix sp. TS-e1954]